MGKMYVRTDLNARNRVKNAGCGGHTEMKTRAHDNGRLACGQKTHSQRATITRTTSQGKEKKVQCCRRLEKLKTSPPKKLINNKQRHTQDKTKGYLKIFFLK